MDTVEIRTADYPTRRLSWESKGRIAWESQQLGQKVPHTLKNTKPEILKAGFLRNGKQVLVYLFAEKDLETDQATVTKPVPLQNEKAKILSQECVNSMKIKQEPSSF